MLLYERLLAEYESIKLTDFWRVYHDELGKQLDLYRSKCEDDENVARSQGSVRAYRYILGRGKEYKPLAERILDELRNKGEK